MRLEIAMQFAGIWKTHTAPLRCSSGQRLSEAMCDSEGVRVKSFL